MCRKTLKASCEPYHINKAAVASNSNGLGHVWGSIREVADHAVYHITVPTNVVTIMITGRFSG